MKKRLFVLVAVLIGITLIASACGSAGEAVSNTVAQLLSGNVKGEIGKTYKTQWFEFTIKSIEKVDSYAGDSPETGYVMYDVLINEKSTFDEEIPMGTFDFYMDAESFGEYIFPLDPVDDTMMPLEFKLNKNDIVEYHMIYVVPADTEGLTLCYTEIDENESEGVVFTIAIN